MKIKKIEFENFRQFKKKGIIRCSTDGKVTIIYGKNGEGKTTLHQLLFWIFYNSYNFNKTTTDKLYNLSYERESRNGEELLSWGKVDFEHNGVDYSIYREWTYKKELQRFKKVNERVQVLKLDENNDWKPFTSSEKEVKKIIEEILPSGLSEYFFFDGESMIADLRVKGKDSANKLKQALYIMFDLAYLDFGIQHIGDSDHSNTVIGSLFSRKVTAVNDLEAGKNKLEMLQAQKQMESVNEVIKEKEENKKNNANRIKFISEEIGAAKSNRQYESERRQQNKNIHVQEQYIQDEKIKFGDDIFDSYKVLLKKRFVLAQKLIKEKLKDSGKDLPLGLEKQLIISLIDEKNNTCICGRKLDEEHKEILKKYLLLFPPYTYNNLYNRLVSSFKTVGKEYDKDKIESHIVNILNAQELIGQFQAQIRKLDEEKKKNEKIQDLIDERIELEEQNKQLDDEIDELNKSYGVYEKIYKQSKKKFENKTKDIKDNKEIERKIKLLSEVKSRLESELKEMSKKYSENLKVNIEFLLNNMLTSRRKVSVTSDFFVKVYDSYGDESKSEGQFAVVSFAYIGAILKLLKEQKAIKNKEYPLVLDGPFSKLDEDQKQNVINEIPKFAPQIILFSKDNLQEYFQNGMIGDVWTIVSNDERNISTIEEGYQWK